MTTTTRPHRTLTGEDRCDRCGAQAYVLVPFPKVHGNLRFCSSHWTLVGDAVKANPSSSTEDIVDDRQFLMVDANLVKNTD